MLQQLYFAFQAYKREQATLVGNLKSGFENRLRSLEASVATTASLLASLSAKVAETNAGAVHSSQCSTKASVGISTDDIAAYPYEEQPYESQASVGQLSSETSGQEKWSPHMLEQIVANEAIRPPMQDLRTINRSDASFERLSNILAEMSRSWIAGSDLNLQFEPNLRKRMEVVCEDLQKAIDLERNRVNLNVGSSYGSSSTFHSSGIASGSFAERHQGTPMDPNLAYEMNRHA